MHDKSRVFDNDPPYGAASDIAAERRQRIAAELAAVQERKLRDLSLQTSMSSSPEERISLQLMGKSPGKGMRLTPIELDLNMADITPHSRRWEAYERLLLDVIEGDSTLFMRRDEVEAAWSWIDPIRQAWDRSGASPKPYTAGTWGPSAAVALIERDGRTWHEDAIEA